MLNLDEFSQWLRDIRDASLEELLSVEKREALQKQEVHRIDVLYQSIHAEVAKSVQIVNALQSQKIAWWKFRAKERAKNELEQARTKVATLTSSQKSQLAQLNKASLLLSEIEGERERILAAKIPEIWRKREASFSDYASKEYKALVGIRAVGDLWIVNGALVAQTRKLTCRGVDIDGRPLARELGVLRVSFFPLRDPEVRNMTRVVSYLNDTWDAPHHPRKMGSCWTNKKSLEGQHGLRIAQGYIESTVHAVISSLAFAKPVSKGETWGVPVLRLFPESKESLIEVEL